VKVKARLLLEKAHRESFDLKNMEQRSDETNHHHHHQQQQQQLGLAGTNTTTDTTDTVPASTGGL